MLDLTGALTNNEIRWLWWAAIRGLWTLFLGDPESQADHVAPPFSSAEWVGIIVVASSITAAAILCLVRFYRSPKAEPRAVS